MLGVNVLVEGEVPVDSCEAMRNVGVGADDCETDEDGTILASGTAEAFSDDNTRGATAVAPSVDPGTGRVVFALYETYAPLPAWTRSGSRLRRTARRT